MSEPAAGRGPFSFSMRSFVLVLLIGVVLASHILTSYRLREAQWTISNLRQLLGEFDVQDRSKVSAVALETGEPHVWRWRLFLPRGIRYRWHMAHGQIPASGLPKVECMSGSVVDSAEEEVFAIVRLTQRHDGVWTCSVKLHTASEGRPIAGGSRSVFGVDFTSLQSKQLGSDGAIAVPTGQPIELLRISALGPAVGGATHQTSQQSPGLMIWLEPH